MANTPEPAESDINSITIDNLKRTASVALGDVIASIAYTSDPKCFGMDHGVVGAWDAYKDFLSAVNAGGSLTDMRNGYRERTAEPESNGRWAASYEKTSTFLAAILESAAETCRLAESDYRVVDPGPASTTFRVSEPDPRASGLHRLSDKLVEILLGE